MLPLKWGAGLQRYSKTWCYEEQGDGTERPDCRDLNLWSLSNKRPIRLCCCTEYQHSCGPSLARSLQPGTLGTTTWRWKNVSLNVIYLTSIWKETHRKWKRRMPFKKETLNRPIRFLLGFLRELVTAQGFSTGASDTSHLWCTAVINSTLNKASQSLGELLVHSLFFLDRENSQFWLKKSCNWSIHDGCSQNLSVFCPNPV